MSAASASSRPRCMIAGSARRAFTQRRRQPGPTTSSPSTGGRDPCASTSTAWASNPGFYPEPFTKTTYGRDAPDRPKARYEYVVTGMGDFPVDMLHFDQCWPVTGDDAAKIVEPASPAEPRSIRMRSHSQPDTGRWSSFGWSVER